MKSKKAKPDLQRKPTSKLFNFLALVTGFTVFLTLLLVGYGYFLGSELEDDTAIVDSENQRTKKRLLESDLTMSEFANEVAVATAEQLTEYLELQPIRGSAIERIPVRIDRNRRRVKAAEQLLLLETTPEQYILAARTKLLALSSIYNTALDHDLKLEVTEEADELKKFAKGLTMERDQEIRIDARLTIVGIDLIESSKGENPDLQSLVKMILDLLKDFPDEPRAAGYLMDIFPQILRISPDFGVALTQMLLSSGKDFTQEHQTKMFQDLYDQAALVKSEWKNKMEAMVVGDRIQHEELIQIAKQLAADEKGGANLVNELEMLTHWLEQEQEYESVVQIYQSLLDSEQARATPEIRKTVKRVGQNGKQRCEMVGKRIELRGIKQGGSQLDSEEFQNQFCAVLFISSERMDLPTLLRDMAEEFTSLSNRNVRFIAVNLDEQPSEYYDGIVQEYPGIQFVTRGDDQAQPPTIYAQYPAHVVPQAILINPEGLVVRTALRLVDLNQIVNEESLKFEKR